MPPSARPRIAAPRRRNSGRWPERRSRRSGTRKAGFRASPLASAKARVYEVSSERWNFSGVIDFLKITAINMPRLTRLAGVAVILAVGAIYLYEAPEHFEAATYLGALFIANAAASLVSAAGIFRGAKAWGWTLGAVVCGLALAAYPISRFFGLPSFPEAAGAWDTPLGTLAMIFEGLFLAGYAAVLTGAVVSAPDKREWHD